jgi:hypothetical protein
MSDLERDFGRHADSAEDSNSEPTPDKAAYEPPELRRVGTLTELVRGSAGKSDGSWSGFWGRPDPGAGRSLVFLVVFLR